MSDDELSGWFFIKNEADPTWRPSCIWTLLKTLLKTSLKMQQKPPGHCDLPPLYEIQFWSPELKTWPWKLCSSVFFPPVYLYVRNTELQKYKIQVVFQNLVLAVWPSFPVSGWHWSSMLYNCQCPSWRESWQRTNALTCILVTSLMDSYPDIYI